MGLLRNALLVNQKKNLVLVGESVGSCVWGGVLAMTSPCFSNGCCNIGGLVETALRSLSFLLEILGGRVSPRRKGHPK
jgi:hypothetical protein